jgi:HEPN superfamily RiboL-PSP-like protein
MVEEGVIEHLFESSSGLAKFLAEAGEPSFYIAYTEQFRKTLLLSAASYFEVSVRDFIVEYVSEKSHSDARLVAFLKAKAVERQYHTYFNWDGNNANSFFGLFGAEFRELMTARVTADEDLKMAVRAFLELGKLRNELVHRDYANFPLDKTADDIFALYETARGFVRELPQLLRTADDPPDGGHDESP